MIYAPQDTDSTRHTQSPATLWAASIYTHHPEQSPQQLALPGAREGDLGSVNPQARPTAPHITPRKPLAEVGAWPTGSSPGLAAARPRRGWISLNSCNTHSLTPSQHSRLGWRWERPECRLQGGNRPPIGAQTLFLAAPGPVTAPRPTLPRSRARAALLCPPVEPARRPSKPTPKTRPSLLGLATRRRQRVFCLFVWGFFF